MSSPFQELWWYVDKHLPSYLNFTSFLKDPEKKLMYHRLLSFINKHNLLYKYQYGFRENHGTDIALMILLDEITSALNNGDMPWGVFRSQQGIWYREP